MNQTEQAHGYPGVRTVLSVGTAIRYLCEQITFDDFVFNYTKSEGQPLSSIAQQNGNPIIVHNPVEMQMNTAFSKAYILESTGSKGGLCGNNLFIDKEVIDTIESIASKSGRSKKVIVENQDSIDCLFPRSTESDDEVYLGFKLDKELLLPEIKNWKPTVYRVLGFYPHDEKRSEFMFALR